MSEQDFSREFSPENEKKEQKESIWDNINPEQQGELRQELKGSWEKRGFIFFDNLQHVSIETRSYDPNDWEVIAVRQRRDYWHTTKTGEYKRGDREIMDERGGVEFLVWKPVQTEDGEWYPNSHIEQRHLIELNGNWQPNNDLTWVRDELEKVSDDKRGKEFDYIKQEMSETIPDKDRREWVEKRVLLEKYRKDWSSKSLELLEREDLILMEKWRNEAEIVLQQWVGMGSMVKLKTPYTLIHEELIRIQIVRDFYWYLSELASNTKDDAKKDEYTQKTVETQELINEYNQFIEEKKGY